ncbi:hypothetical protein ABID26_001198 [Mesorhizobium shonense]|uniref:N-acetyltransferase domain-containing protein n=1 Tax=Mesorhizobium shonense TaxID=1209948 RepID=A0ABV2HML8_9HYPH
MIFAKRAFPRSDLPADLLDEFVETLLGNRLRCLVRDRRMSMERDRKADEERQALKDHLCIAPDMTEVTGKTVKPHTIAPVELVLATPLDEGFDGLRNDRRFGGRGIATEVVQLLAQLGLEQKLMTNAVGLHAACSRQAGVAPATGTSIGQTLEIAYGRYLR